jgi:alkanesulfonate monooxygenase SsuD/methylene tetrahydromethanopterin reductase-like flavin-dependent oxidoreductase (luciferase family)
MREYLAVPLPLIRGGEVDFRGEMLRAKARYQVPGGPSMPVMLAALRPAMLRLAGETADETADGTST